MKKILVVEDEQDIAEIISMALVKNGYSTDMAFDGEEALEKINLSKPDIIVLDLMLPKLDGQSVNIKLKENPDTAQIPVIVITAHAKLKELLQARSDFNVTAYLEKPFPLSTLVEKIREIAGRG